MKRKILIGLFSLGTIGGFGSFAVHAMHLHCAHRAAFEHHIAKVCTDAARESRESESAKGP